VACGRLCWENEPSDHVEDRALKFYVVIQDRDYTPMYPSLMPDESCQ
jgi:hypothetical protein